MQYVVGIQQRSNKHILQNLCTQLGKQGYVLINGARREVGSASTSTTNLSKSVRMARERRRLVVGSKVYEIIDDLRMNNIVAVKDIRKYLRTLQNSITEVQGYIKLRKTSEFKELRKQQFLLREQILGIAGKRSQYMSNVDKNKASILSYLYKEIVLIDKLGERDKQVGELCEQVGVNGQPFFEASKLVSKVWGVVAKSLFEQLGKY